MPWHQRRWPNVTSPSCISALLEGPRHRSPWGWGGKNANSASSLSSGVGQRRVSCSDGASGAAPDVTAGRRSHYPRVSPRSVCESVYPPVDQMAKKQNPGPRTRKAPLAARSGHSTTPQRCQIVNLMPICPEYGGRSDIWQSQILTDRETPSVKAGPSFGLFRPISLRIACKQGAGRRQRPSHPMSRARVFPVSFPTIRNRISRALSPASPACQSRQ